MPGNDEACTHDIILHEAAWHDGYCADCLREKIERLEAFTRMFRVQEAGGRRALVVTLPDGSAAAFLEGDTHDIANNVRASVMAMLIPHAAALATPPAAKEA